MESALADFERLGLGFNWRDAQVCNSVDAHRLAVNGARPVDFIRQTLDQAWEEERKCFANLTGVGGAAAGGAAGAGASGAGDSNAADAADSTATDGSDCSDGSCPVC